MQEPEGLRGGVQVTNLYHEQQLRIANHAIAQLERRATEVAAELEKAHEEMANLDVVFGS